MIMHASDPATGGDLGRDLDPAEKAEPSRASLARRIERLEMQVRRLERRVNDDEIY